MNEISAYVLPVLKVFDKDIIDAVCKVYNISPKHIFISSRRRGITEPRQIVTSLIMLLSERGAKYIENAYGINHSTALYSIGIVKALYKNNSQYRRNIHSILRELGLAHDKVIAITRVLREETAWKKLKEA